MELLRPSARDYVAKLVEANAPRDSFAPLALINISFSGLKKTLKKTGGVVM